MIVRKLSSVVESGTPRSASLAPSSTITMLGLSRCISAGMRARPPLVVSPLMLALATL